MDAKTTSVIAHIGIIGFLVAYIFGDKESSLSQFHLNQGLVLGLFAILSPIPCIGWILGIIICVFEVMGIVNAVNEEEKPAPWFGGIQIIFK